MSSAPDEGGPAPAAGAGNLKDRRRRIQRAIRRREDPPPGLEDLAMQVALRQAGLRWFVVLYGLGFVLEVVNVVVKDGTGARVREGLIGLAFLLVGYLQWQVGQRARDAVERWSRREGQQGPAAPG